MKATLPAAQIAPLRTPRILSFFLLFSVTLFLFVFLNVQKASAYVPVVGDVVLAVEDELGGTITGATLYLQCDGGVSTPYTDGAVSDEDGELAADGTIVVSAATLLANATGNTDEDCDDGDAYTLGGAGVVQDGYVVYGLDASFTPVTYATGSINTATSAMQFGQKVTVTREGDAAVISGAAVGAGSLHPSVWCTEGAAGVYYCPVPIAEDGTANDIGVIATGYVSNVTGDTIDRDDDGDPQMEITVSSVQFQLKVVVADQGGGAVNVSDLFGGGDETGIAFNGSAVTYSSTNNAYWAIAPATRALLFIRRDGYVDSNVTNSSLVGDEELFTGVTTSASAQTVVTLASAGVHNGETITSAGNPNNVKGLEFAQIITVTREGDDAAFTGATVTAGVGDSVTCLTPGGGAYYCAIPIAEDGAADIHISKSGYVDTTATSTNRVASSPQSSVTVTDVLFQLKVVLGDELGGVLPGGPDTATFNGFAPDSAGGGYGYFAQDTVTRGALVVSKDGYVNSDVTNTSLAASGSTGVTTSPSAQVVVTFGNFEAATGGVINSSTSVKGMQFGFKITEITTEASGNDLTATLTSLAVGDETGTTACGLDTGVWYCPVVTENSDALVFEQVTGTAVQTGYVTAALDLAGTGTRNSNDDVQISTTLAGVQFNKKINGTDELGNNITLASCAAGTATVDSISVSGGNCYAAVTVEGTVTLTATGYVTKTSGVLTADDAAQIESNSANLFNKKINGTDELGNVIALTGCTLATGAAVDVQPSGGDCYVAVTEEATVTLTKAGYVTATTGALTASDVAQVESDSDNLFTVKVTTTSGGSALTGATVSIAPTAGGTAVTTADATVSNVKYFALDPATYGTSDITVSKSGYNSNTSNTSQTVSASQQLAKSIALSVVSSGGGGGGPAGNGSFSGPAVLSTISSTTAQLFTTSILLPSTGKVVRPTTLSNNFGSQLDIPKDTSVTTSTGAVYTGTISVPTVMSEASLPKPVVTGNEFVKAVVIKTTGGVKFSQNVTITIPLPEGAGKEVKVYFYNETTQTYDVAGNGGVLSADGKSIVMTVDHLTTFVAMQPVGTGSVVVSTTGSATMAGPFVDTKDHWAVEYIQKLYDLGVVKGRGDTTFEPNATLTRAEMVKIAMMAFDYEVDMSATTTFTDVDASAWYVPYLAAAQKAEVIGGYPDGTFKPNGAINRAEALKILLSAAKAKVAGSAAASFTDVASDAWFASYVNFAFEKGIVKGKSATLFAPQDNVTRGEMSKLAVKIMELQE